MTSLRTPAAHLRRTSLLASSLAAFALPIALGAQQGAPARGAPPASAARQGFDLFAVVDFAATGVRAASPYRFFVTNSGPMDIQARAVTGTSPASVLKSGEFISQFPEIALFATAAPGDRLANLARVPSLANVTGGGAALSFNYHRDQPGITQWYAVDGALGFSHSGVRSSAVGCLNHSPNLGPGVTLMPASDCPQTWGLNGWEGRRPIPQAAYLTIFNADKPGFRFNFFSVPFAFQDTSGYLGARFQTYGIANDYSRDRLPRFGSVIPGGSGAPREQGYPMGLQWKFDAFTVSDAPGVVFWQATVTNRSDSVYVGTPGIDYDSLYVGVLARHGRRSRTHAGFDPARGTAFFNDIGNDDATVPGGCDSALPVPGNYASDAFFGDCREPIGFGAGASAIVFLKSPIGDLRYKLFSDPTSLFSNPASPVLGDTITFNIGRMCGDDCIGDRAVSSATAGFGVIAAREALALNGDAPTALSAQAYWMLFHPANGASTDLSRRVNLTNPRAGGGFNFTALPGWRYSTRPSSAPATGSDTLWYDTCNPALDPATVPIVVPATRAQVGRCTGRWIDSLPDKTLNFTRGATWLGAGPFKLRAGETQAMTLAIVTGADSATIENNVNGAINLYQTFFVARTPPPAPRITSVRVTGGTIRQTGVRLYFENRAVDYVDPFLLQLANQFATAPATGNTIYSKLNRLNPRLGPAGRTLADTIRLLAAKQVSGYNIYKSCNPGSGQYTRSTSPNLCTIDFVTDSLGRTIGPAVYGTVNDTTYTFSDGNVLAGLSYQYIVVPVSRGVRLQLVTDTAVVAGVGTTRIAKDTVLVTGSADLPSLLTAQNVATVYVPASVQSGGAVSRVRYLGETGPQTYYGDSASYTGPFITVADSLSDTLNFRFVVGDSLRLREFQTSGGIDSTVVVVYRSAPIGFTFASALTTDPFSRYAIPTRRFQDSLVFVRRDPVRVGQSIVGTLGPPAAGGATVQRNDTTTIALGGGRREVRTTLKFTGGALATAGTIFTAPTTVLANLPQGVLLQRKNGVDVPVIVGNDFRSNTFGFSSKLLGSPDYSDVIVDAQNRPLMLAYTPTGTPNYGGLQVLDRYFTDPQGGRFGATGSQSAIPTIFFQSAISRFIGTNSGEYSFNWFDTDWGPGAPFTLANGVTPLQQALDASLAARARPSQTVADAATVAAINASLGTTLTADSLLVVNLPFKVVDNSRDRSAGGRPVLAAIRKSDKFYAPETLPVNGVGADPNRYLLLGTGLDTARVTVPIDQWVPGEPLILLEKVPVADTANGTLKRNGTEVVYRDTLLVVASRATLGCNTRFPAFCNPLQGRGGTGYSPTQQGYSLVVRTGVPFAPEREQTFAVTPLVAGTRVRQISRAQMDSVKVVPNPYILYSSFEQSTANEQRIMFTHLPPEGVLRIYTAAGQFVQQVRWTPADLNGTGDLYFNLLTREGTLMASGLYLFTVEATGAARMRRQQVGRFIIIR